MTEEHYIQWISLETQQGNQRKMLAPGAAPKAGVLHRRGRRDYRRIRLLQSARSVEGLNGKERNR